MWELLQSGHLPGDDNRFRLINSYPQCLHLAGVVINFPWALIDRLTCGR